MDRDSLKSRRSDPRIRDKTTPMWPARPGLRQANLPLSSSTFWVTSHSGVTYQQSQCDGHEHGTARHARQANEVQGPPASSLHHKQLWAGTVSVPPLPDPPGNSPTRKTAPTALVWKTVPPPPWSYAWRPDRRRGAVPDRRGWKGVEQVALETQDRRLKIVSLGCDVGNLHVSQAR